MGWSTNSRPTGRRLVHSLLSTGLARSPSLCSVYQQPLREMPRIDGINCELTRHIGRSDLLAVFFWRVQSAPNARKIMLNTTPGSFDMNKDGVCTSTDQGWANEVLESRLVMLVTRVIKPNGIEQAWIVRNGVLSNMKLPNYVHKLSRDEVRASCNPLVEWALRMHEESAYPFDETLARARAVEFVMTSSFGRFSCIERFGYGLATRMCFQDAHKLPGFDGNELVEALKEVLEVHSAPIPEMLVLDKLLNNADCDSVFEQEIEQLVKTKKKKYRMEKVTLQWPVHGRVLQDAATDDGKLRILVRTKSNSDAFLVMQTTINDTEVHFTNKPAAKCSVLPPPFAANWVCLLGRKHVFYGYARTPRNVKETARVIATTMNFIEEECPICLESLSIGRTNVSKCGHVMHEECLKRLVRSNGASNALPSCPTCRAPLTISTGGMTKEQKMVKLQEAVVL